MTAVSISIQRGTTGTKNSDITVGTSAPNASVDIELRWQQLDLNSKHITRKDLIIALAAFRRAILTDGNVTFTTGVIGPP